MQTKKIFALPTACLVSFLSLTVYANNFLTKDMGISNQTEHTLYFQVNHVCAKNLGMILPYTKGYISLNNLTKACGKNLTPCEIKAFNSSFCYGQSFGGIQYNFTTKNANIIAAEKNRVSITFNDFTITYKRPL